MDKKGKEMNKLKEFNTTGVCVPSKHYMVDISDKLEQMIVLIEKGKYFTMNRSRQYGKTTTLASLYRRLKEKYIVLRLSFEGLGEEAFADSRSFVEMFIDAVADFWNLVYEDEIPMKAWTDRSVFLEFPQKDSFDLLGKKITKLCQQTDREILLFVDEVDKSSDNQIFLNFLGMLRNKYLRREEGLDDTFKSVILAGVYDVKNLKLMLRPEEEKKYNSPWNVAVDFNIDMSFSPEEIATMLKEYESDYHTGMDIMEVSGEIYKYTSGYPYLVSYICQWIDTKGEREFQTNNIRKAVNYLIREGGTLLDDLIKNYENVRGLQTIVDQMLFCGQEFACVKTNPAISLGFTFGIFKEKDTMLAISNLIFEDILINHVSSKKQQEECMLSAYQKNEDFV